MKLTIIHKNKNIIRDRLIDAGYSTLSESFDVRTYGKPDDGVSLPMNSRITHEESKFLKTLSDEIDDILLKNDARFLIQSHESNSKTKLKSLKGFMLSLDKLIKNNIIDGWVYRFDNKIGEYLPMLVNSCRHMPYNYHTEEKAHIIVTFNFTSSSESSPNDILVRDSSYRFYMHHISGSSIEQCLWEQGLFKETDKLKKAHEEHMNLYECYSDKVGKQFTINRNKHRVVNDYIQKEYRNVIPQTSSCEFFHDITPTDDEIKSKGLNSNVSNWFSDIAQTEMSLPFHPYIPMFNLDTHTSLRELPGRLTPYVYDDQVINKIILPSDHCDLIDVLVCDADVVLEDIVSNKSGGTSILCKGNAGLGKTLTAEVYAETIGKPLYIVHSGQLGTSPDTIDNKLDKILTRAERWGAILLIDEADVYIRKRDNSINHNAIVATFLRKLERFNGILFMTTNRSDDVDDAIASRCIAIIDYDYPTGNELFKLWKVLSTQYKIDLSDKLINELCGMFHQPSGRDIKELLKLASKFKSQRKIKIDRDMFRKCAMFRGLKSSN